MKQMRTIFTATALVLLMMGAVSCDKNGESKQELRAKYDTLLQEKAQSEESLNEAISLINEVESNLTELTQAEHMIEVGAATGELTPSERDRILGKIEILSKSLQENRAKINDQEAQLKKRNIRISSLTQKLNSLQSQLDEKEAIIVSLQEQLGGLTARVAQQDSLIGNLEENQRLQDATIQLQDRRLAKQEAELYTAHYCFGTMEELRGQKILTGGGLFSSVKVLPEGFNKDYFLTIDTRNVTSIALFAPRARVRTDHPASSYRLDTDSEGNKLLRILDAEAFWSKGRYLVIEVEPK